MVNPFHSGYRYTGTLANSVDPDVMRRISGSALFANIETIFRGRNTPFYRNYDRQPLKIQNWISPCLFGPYVQSDA